MIEPPNITTLYVFLAFGICYWILKKYLFVPLSAILDGRLKAEAEAEQAYAESLRTLEKAVASGEEQLSAARREALKSREDRRAEGLALLNAKLAEAHAASLASIERGSKEIEAQASGSAKELPERARSLARELAEKILGRKLAA
jgi:F-type H+-transporting ATPase subunit b